MSKPSILLVTPSPLLPADSGGRIYVWGLVSELADRFDYHLLAMCNPDERVQLDAGAEPLMEQYRSVFKSVRFVDRPPIPAQLPRRKVLGHLWFHLRHGLPLMDVSYYSSEAVAAARSVVQQENIDLIEVDHLQMAYIKKFLPKTRAVLVNHNIETDLYPFFRTKRWSLPAMAVWLAFGWFSRRNGRKIELANRLGFAAKLFISSADAAKVDESCPKVVIPLPMSPSDRNKEFNTDPFKMLWLGGFDWPPNAEAIRWFVDEVWPLMSNRLPNAELHIVGGSPPKDLTGSDARITFHGYQDDVDSWRADSDVLVAPLLSGSGVRVKIVEALAAGLPVVSTSKGCEGLEVKTGVDVVVADQPQDFAEALVELAGQPELRSRLGAAGKEYVAHHHAPHVVAARKAEALSRAVAS